MALDAFVAGRYSGTYNAVDVGITTEGFRIQQDSKVELVTPSDAYGDSVIDMVYRGGDFFITTECKAFKTGSVTPFWPWGALGVMATAAAPIGRLASDIFSALVLTATANTPFAGPTAGPAGLTINTLTASKSGLAENSPQELLFNSRLRMVPMRLRALPTEAGGTVRWFTTT